MIKKKNLKICMLNPSFPPYSGWKRDAVRAHELAIALVEAGHCVDVISSSSEELPFSYQEGVAVHRLALPTVDDRLNSLNSSLPNTLFNLKICLSYWRYFIDLHNKNGFDIIDSAEIHGLGLIGGLSKLLPIVLRLEDTLPMLYEKNLHQLIFQLDSDFTTYMKQKSILSADKIVSTNSALLDQIKAGYKISESKVFLQNNLVRMHKFNSGCSSAINNKDKTVLIIANPLKPEIRNSLKTFIKAINEKHQKIQFIIYAQISEVSIAESKGFGEARADLEDSATENNVSVLASIARAILPNYVNSANLCLTFCDNELYPMTELECLACGIPVLMACDSQSTAIDENAFFKSSTSVNELISRCLNLLDNEGLLSELSQNGKNYVNKSCNSSTVANQVSNMYLELVESKDKEEFSVDSLHQSLNQIEFLISSFDQFITDRLYADSIRHKVSKLLRKIVSNRRGNVPTVVEKNW